MEKYTPKVISAKCIYDIYTHTPICTGMYLLEKEQSKERSENPMVFTSTKVVLRKKITQTMTN